MTFQLTEKQQEATRLLAGPAQYILLRGGARSGKTFVLTRAIIARALLADGSRHAVFRRYLNAARASIWKLTLREVLEKCFPGLAEKSTFNETDMTLTLPNGSVIMVLGMDDDARLQKILGLEFVTIYLNEATEITAWSSVSLVTTRLAQRVALNNNAAVMMRPKFFADMNPDSAMHWACQMFREKLKPGTREALTHPDNYAEMKINPIDNTKNIAAGFLENLENTMTVSERRRFIDGEWSNEIEGSLFTQDVIDRNRIAVGSAPTLDRIVIAVDPSVTSGVNADETGIIVAGLGSDGRVYVLGDYSMKGATPDAWANEVVRLYREYYADRVIAERNQGGDMIETILRTIDRNISYKALWSSRGKVSRAEPVSALYERSMVSHVGDFALLESQLTSLTSGFSAAKAGFSPDRADALVFAVTELLVTGASNTGKFTAMPLRGF